MYAFDMQCQSTVVPEELPLFHDNPVASNLRKGKEKDVYDFGDVLLLIATDYTSAFGERLGQEIKGKGRIVTQMSAYWFRELRNICPSHLISVNQACFPDPIKAAAGKFDGQAMLVWKTTPLPIRCIVRGYLAGAGWREYRETGEICGNKLPSGLVESQRLPAPIFAPATKGKPAGQDENIHYHSLQALLGETLAEQLRETSLRLYFNAWKSARERGVLIADTSFEFGLHDGKLVLIDECLTPGTSRFWQINRYRSGGPMPSMDKQILVDFLESLGTPEMTPLSDEMLSRLRDKYREAYKLIVGRSFISQGDAQV
jgi:phosphoribosylaminoimidazole-succinocarboxamide synthase